MDNTFIDESVELHDAWLALCKYFGPQRKARALATFKQLDTDRSGTLDQMEFKMFIAMVRKKRIPQTLLPPCRLLSLQNASKKQISMTNNSFLANGCS